MWTFLDKIIADVENCGQMLIVSGKMWTNAKIVRLKIFTDTEKEVFMEHEAALSGIKMARLNTAKE